MRLADCHPSVKHYAHGLCWPCYSRRYESTPARKRRQKSARDVAQAKTRRARPEAKQKAHAYHLTRYAMPSVRQRMAETARRRNATPEGRATKLYSQYKITPEQRTALLSAQGGTCALPFCHENATAIDHDHGCCRGRKICGRCIRGLLCGPHNRALGIFRDSPDCLKQAIEYLEGDYVHLSTLTDAPAIATNEKPPSPHGEGG